MDPKKVVEILTAAEQALPEGPEKIVLLVMRGNLLCGAGNTPLAQKAQEIAIQILADITH